MDGFVIPSMQRGVAMPDFHYTMEQLAPRAFLCASPETTALAPMCFSCPIFTAVPLSNLACDLGNPLRYHPAAVVPRPGSRDRMANG